MAFHTMLQWADGADEICAHIANRFSPFKILLKTKDEPGMLEAWIARHSKIVGFGGLLIFDNMSTDPGVEAIYEKYRSTVSIYRYHGFHNLIHHTDRFAPLYAAIRKSCKHFVFLDTDEHLSLYDGADRFYADSSVITFLGERQSTHAFPGTWLQNITGYTDHFSLYDPSIPLSHGLKWGKPILSATAGFHGMINHNTQIDHALYSPALTTNFFVLHLSRVSKSQRIEANLRKLRSYDAIAKECGLEGFLAVDLETLQSDQVKMYAREIYELLDANTSDRAPLTGWIRISESGALVCSQAWQREALAQFVAQPQNHASNLLDSATV